MLCGVWPSQSRGNGLRLLQLAPAVLGSPLPPASPALPAGTGSTGRLRRCSPKCRDRVPKHGEGGTRSRGWSPLDCKAGLTRLPPPARPVANPTSPWELCPGVSRGRLVEPPSPCNSSRALPCPPRAGPRPRGRCGISGALLPHRPRPRTRRHSPASHGAHPRPAEARSSAAACAPRQGGIRAVPPNPALPSGPDLGRLSKGLIFPGFKPSPAVSELRALSLALFF